MRKNRGIEVCKSIARVQDAVMSIPTNLEKVFNSLQTDVVKKALATCKSGCFVN